MADGPTDQQRRDFYLETMRVRWSAMTTRQRRRFKRRYPVLAISLDHLSSTALIPPHRREPSKETTAMTDMPAPMTDVLEFERGARAAAESMKLYFCNENEYPMFEGLSSLMLDDFEAGAIADAVRDEQLRVERLGERRPLVVPSGYRVLPTGYASSELVDKNAFEVAVEWRGQDPETSLDRWAVTHMGRCLSADDEWEHEPMPSSRDEDFLRRFRFSLQDALRLATDAVDGVRINGRTLAQWDEHLAAGS